MNRTSLLREVTTMEKSKRIVAIIAIIILVASYITTLVAALIDSPFAAKLFQASLFCSCVVPIVIYGYILIIRLAKNINEQK